MDGAPVAESRKFRSRDRPCAGCASALFSDYSVARGSVATTHRMSRACNVFVRHCRGRLHLIQRQLILGCDGKSLCP